jgi:hypothetical protein
MDSLFHMKYFAHVCFVCNKICNFIANLLVTIGFPCYNNIVISTIEMKEYMLPWLRPIFFKCLHLILFMRIESQWMEPQPFFWKHNNRPLAPPSQA